MFRLINFCILILCFNYAFAQQGNKTSAEKEKTNTREEIKTELHNLILDWESVNPERFYNHFLHNNDFVVATQGKLITEPKAILDTIKVHLADQKSQKIKLIDSKIYVINAKAAVVSASATTDITFKNGKVLRGVPFAVTMLYIKKNGSWKITQYHN